MLSYCNLVKQAVQFAEKFSQEPDDDNKIVTQSVEIFCLFSNCSLKTLHIKNMVNQSLSEKNTAKSTGQADCHQTWSCICRSEPSHPAEAQNHEISCLDSGKSEVEPNTTPFSPNYDIYYIIKQHEN